MKIGILTYHRAVNEGSILQAYCLHRLLGERFPDARIEFVDYRSVHLERSERRRLLRRRPPFFHKPYLETRRELRGFLRDQTALSKRSCTTNDLDKARRFVHDQGYDAVFVGSDTVWEIREQDAEAGRTVTWNSPRVPNIYFLPELEGIKKIAFAVSADPVEPVDKLLADKPRHARFLEAAGGFDRIFYRDEMTRVLLEQVGLEANRLHFMPDPAILHDFSDIVDVPTDVPGGDRPIAGVGVPVPHLQAELTKKLRDLGYDVIHLLGASGFGGWRVPAHYTFSQRLGIHAKLDLIVTDRFHRSILTLKLSGSPVLFIEHGKWLEENSKGRDLLKRLGYESMVWRYDGGGVPEGLIEKYLGVWKDLSPRVADDMERLQQRGEEGLDRIQEILATK